MNEITMMDKIRISQNDALLIIDMQYDFLEGGSLEVPRGNEIIPGINQIAKKFYEHDAIIIFTQDWHPKGHFSFASSHEGKKPFDTIEGIKGIGPILWPDHCIQESKGAEFHEKININLGHLIIRKGYRKTIDSYSALLENDKETETGLDGFLKSLLVRRVFVCGLALDYCVNYSAQDAKKKGYDVFVLEDLSRGISTETIKTSKLEMTNLGIKFI